MKFGAVPLAQSVGAFVAHAVRLETLVLKKGDVIQPEHVALLREAGLSEIIVAQLDAGDVGEDVAAARLAEVMAGKNIRADRAFTGRTNLFADVDGLLVVEALRVDAVNAVDEAITLATLTPMQRVVAGDMVATVKIIPFAVPGKMLDDAVAAAELCRLRVAPFRAQKIGVISTLLPGLKPSVIAKTLRVLAQRLEVASADICVEVCVPHDAQALSEAIIALEPQCDVVIVFGASAITDRRDVIPLAVELSGGRIEHFGMPVDPGNLLLLAQTKMGKPLLGAPGCARSPKENGFDWVLQRILADVPVRAADIRRMGAGGLLMEIVTRPQPRLPDA